VGEGGPCICVWSRTTSHSELLGLQHTITDHIDDLQYILHSFRMGDNLIVLNDMTT